MEISQIAMGLVMIGGLAGYYWYTVGRKGGVAGYQKNLLGLRDGEQLTQQWTAAFDFDIGKGEQVVDALMGMHTRGKTLYVGITNANRLVIGHMEDSKEQPLSYEHGQVAITHHSDKAKNGRMAGMSGMEPGHVIQLAPAGSEPFRLQIAASAAQALQTWAASGQ